MEIKAKSVACNQDPLVYLMTDCYDVARARSNDQLEKFIEQVSTVLKWLFESECIYVLLHMSVNLQNIEALHEPLTIIIYVQ